MNHLVKSLIVALAIVSQAACGPAGDGTAEPDDQEPLADPKPAAPVVPAAAPPPAATVHHEGLKPKDGASKDAAYF